MAFAIPVQRGDFSFNGDLYADAGDFNRHKRATVAELTDILRPDFKKSKAIDGAKARDEPAHFFAAQCLHYGLPPSKQKATSKMRLLDALNKSNLAVPAHIVGMESDMKKEYATAERKAKAVYKANTFTSSSSSAPTPATKKRKQSELTASSKQSSTPSTNKSASTIDDGTSPAKKARSQQPMRQENSGPFERPKQTARSDNLAAVWKRAIEYGLPPPGPPPVGCHITSSGSLARDIDGSPVYNVVPKSKTFTSEELEVNGSAKANTETKTKKSAALKKETKEGTTKKQTAAARTKPAVKKEPKTKKEPKVEGRPRPKQENSVSSLGFINGTYEIECSIDGEWPDMEPDDGCTLILTLDSPQVWGAYDFGMYSGIICIANRPTSASKDDLYFRWRGRENSEGIMRFGPSCNGYISFLGNGTIGGTFTDLYGNVEFQGRRLPGPPTPVRTAASMKDEWDGYNQEAYDEANRARWR